MAIRSLPREHQLQLSEAQGWYELNNLVEAKRALGRIRGSTRFHPDVLELSWKLKAATNEWESCLQIADRLTEVAPERVNGWLFMSAALHKLQYTQDACETLQMLPQPVAESPAIPYQLACYMTQLGRFQEALGYLEHALERCPEKDAARLALADPELQPLWANLRFHAGRSPQAV